MSLTGLAQQDSGPGSDPANTGDKFKQVLAYIPTEIVTLYVTAAALVKASSVIPQFPWFLGLSIAGVIACAVWVFVANSQSSTKLPASPLYYRAVAAVLAFACWIYALGYAIPDGFAKKPEYGLTSGLALLFVPPILAYFGTVVNRQAALRN